MPPSAWWLGVHGLIPFVGCTVVSIVCAYNVSVIAREALLFYGAVILSFLGGIQWGFSVKGEDVALTVKPSMGRLCLTTVPALIGWLSLMLPPGVSSIVLMVAFIMTLIIDLIKVRDYEAPNWYPKLRWPLTVIVTCCLILSVRF